MARKLTMVGLAALFGTGTRLQLFCTSFLSFAWLALHVTQQPYFFVEDNMLKALCEIIILGTIQAAGYSFNADEQTVDMYSALQLALYVFMVPVCVAVVAIKVVRARAKPTRGRDPVAQAFAMCLNGTMSSADRAVLAAYFRRVSDEVDEMRRRWQACPPSSRANTRTRRRTVAAIFARRQQ